MDRALSLEAIEVPDLVAVRRVLVSVFDKSHLSGLLRTLASTARSGVTAYSTGGTYKELEAVRIASSGTPSFELVAISDYTGYPEMPKGLVKTLHPKIHAGILAESGSIDQAAYLESIGALAFDMVVCNLYPFEQVAALPGASTETLRQNIDIGGPTMVRAAAKNFLRVVVVVDPEDYSRVEGELAGRGGVSLETRLYLARKAFEHVRAYDEAICRALAPRDRAALGDSYRVLP